MSIGHNADARLRSFIDRVLRLKEEQDALAADIREVYAEAKGDGYDKTAMGALVAHLRKIEKKGSAAIEEASTVFDLYLDAYQRASGTLVATHTHEKFPPHNPVTGELADEESVQSQEAAVGCEPAERSSGGSLGTHSNALVAQRIEQEASNLSVAGSNPAERSIDNPVPHTFRVDGGQPDPSSDAMPSGQGGDQPGITSGKSGHQSASAAQAGNSVGSASGASATHSKADDFDPGDIPTFLRRTDGYAAASGRGA